MTNDSKTTVAGDMTMKDLDGVAEVHRLCFPPSTSIFSALSRGMLKDYYALFVEEPESYAAVLKDAQTGQIAGVTFGTRKPGIQQRFLKKHFIKFFFSSILGLLTGTAMWEAIRSRLQHRNSLSLGAYDADAAAAGIPAPNGVEDLNMGIAVHPEYRGGGNATKLIEYYTTRVFEMGVTRIRGAILKNNIASMTFFKKRGWTFMEISDNEVSVWIDKPATAR